MVFWILCGHSQCVYVLQAPSFHRSSSIFLYLCIMALDILLLKIAWKPMTAKVRFPHSLTVVDTSINWLWLDTFNNMELLYFWTTEWRPALYYNGVAGTLQLKKRLPDVVVTVVVPDTWETHALKRVSGKVCFAALPTRDLVIYLLSYPLNWSPCRTFLEPSLRCSSRHWKMKG